MEKLPVLQSMELIDSVPILSLTWLCSEDDALRQPVKTTSQDKLRETCLLELVRRALLG